MWHNVAFDLWQDLMRRYCQGDIFKIAELDDELSSIKQGDLTITAYFTRLKVIWEELENLRPIPQCVACDSNNCLCGLMKVRKYQDDAYVVRFLKGLNEAYSNVRSQVMMMEPVPKIDQVLSMILQQERQLHTLEPIDCKALISASNNFSYPNRGRGRGRAPGRSHGRGRGATKQCSFCGKLGHLVDVCYKKHGMPPHLKQGNQSLINNMIAEENDEKFSTTQGEASKGELEFTIEQKRALISLLQQPDMQQNQTNQIVALPSNQGIAYVMSLNVFKSNSWVIDSGATDHVSFSLESYQLYHQIKPIIVKLPDGTHISTSIAGTIVFSKQFLLLDVLFIPQFKFNLISVSKLTKSLHCELVFDDMTCKIQDCLSQKIIGQAEQRKGLYAFEDLNPVGTSSIALAKVLCKLEGGCDLTHMIKA
ncbi:uncharacterized protein LOC107628080 [Arachis ipaensis]|uniref:uncharacterized protein LOC107628080 n=1 Tax=Arachis ipaensis TaxID=130454 RepID=UPI0007AF5367|nr:uncharacterized protein LOC107628080 [Arachis ipaensis]